MSVEANKTAMRRVPEEIFNRGELAVADEVMHAEYVEHAPLPPGSPSGVKAPSK